MGRPHHVLFVCSGNICRSPMAEGLARAYAAATRRSMEVRSAGTLGIIDHPADSKAVAVCAEVGVDISGHLSQGLSEDLVSWADYVLVMEYGHARHLRDHYPEVGDDLLMLGAFGGLFEIEDPIGSWKLKFRRSRDEIDRCVRAFVDRLPPEQPGE